MNGETNENLDELNVDNAFSDLLSQYFTDENNTTNAGNINVGPVLDWDSVANGQLYTNVTAKGIQGTLNNQINNAGTTGKTEGLTSAEGIENDNGNGLLYNNLGTINGGELATQAQGTENGNGGLYTNLGTVGGENIGIGEELADNGQTNNNEQTQNVTNILYLSLIHI